MGLEEQLLAASIRTTIKNADNAAYRLYNVETGNTLHNVETGPHADELAEATSVLDFYVEKAFRDTAILAERLSLPLFRVDVAATRGSFKALAELIHPPEDTYVCPALDAVRQQFLSLASMTEGRALTGLGVFETVLQNTAKLIQRAGVEPSSEAEVTREVRRVLDLCFSGVVEQIPIAKSLKTYKPDIGVTPLMAAAEYKFVDSEAEAKKVLDEIYADMKGYGGRYDWRSFYAIIYMTAPYYTQKAVEDEWRLVKAELSWTPYVVVGRGGRRKKVRA